jgi:hypothetical protein
VKLSSGQLQSLTEKVAEKVLDHWKKQNLVTFKEDEKKVFARMTEVLRQDLQKESDLEREVHRMLDELENTHRGEFQRSKMYPILKKKLAKERKVIL